MRIKVPPDVKWHFRREKLMALLDHKNMVDNEAFAARVQKAMGMPRSKYIDLPNRLTARTFYLV